MNTLQFYKGIEKIFKHIYRNEISIYNVENQNIVNDINDEIKNNFNYNADTLIEDVISNNERFDSFIISGGYKNVLNPSKYEFLETQIQDGKCYIIQLEISNYDRSIKNKLNLIINKNNYKKDTIVSKITRTIESFEELIFGESIGMIVGDEMGSIGNILTVGQSFYQLDFDKVFEAIKFLCKINHEMKSKPVSFHLGRLNVMEEMVFESTDMNIESSLQVIFFLYLKGVTEKSLIRLYKGVTEKTFLSSRILSLTDNILNAIDFKNISITKLNKIAGLQFKKQRFIELMPLAKDINISKDDISLEKVKTIFNRLITIQEKIFIHNIRFNRLHNLEILENHFTSLFIKDFIKNTVGINENDINYLSINNILSKTKINYIPFKEGYEFTSFKNFGILLKYLKNININDVCKKISVDKRYKEDKFIMKPLIKHLNVKSKNNINIQDLNKFIFIYYKDIIFDNITDIMNDLGYNKSVYKVGKKTIIKLLDNNDGFSNLFHKTNLENLSSEIYWYRKNISTDKNIINNYILKVSKGTIIGDDYRQSVVNVLYGIHKNPNRISNSALIKLNTLFLKSENEIGSHNTYMDRYIYQIKDKKLLENIILKSDKLDNVRDLLGKVSLAGDFLRNLGTFDFGNRNELKELAKEHINSILTEMREGNTDVGNTITEYLNNFEKTLLEYKKYSKKDLKKYIRNSKGLDNTLTYIQLINKTFDGDTDFFNKLKTLTKNIQTGSMPHIKSNVYYRKNQLLIPGFDRIKELIGTKDKKGDAVNPGKMFKYIKTTYPNIIDNIKTNTPIEDKIVKDLLYKYDKNTDNIITFFIKLENVTNEQYWCAGDYSKCCMGHTYDKQKTYIWDKGFHIINIYMNNKVIANSLIFVSYIDGVKTLVLDSFENNSTYNNFIPFYKDSFIKYINHLKCVNLCNDIILSGVYNKNLLFPIKRNTLDNKKVKPIGVDYFLAEPEKKHKNIHINKTSYNLFDKFKKYCYSDFNVKSLYGL